MVEEGLGGREGVEDDGGGVRGGNEDVVMEIGIDEGGVEGAEKGEEAVCGEGEEASRKE